MLRVWGLRILAGLGFACVGSSMLWYYYLYKVSPRVPTGDQVVRAEEHGAQFFVRPWEGHLIGILSGGGMAIILLVAWLDWRDAKKHGRLKPYSPIPDWRGRQKADPRDIFTYEFGFYIAAWIILVGLTIGTGGKIPFGIFQAG